MAISVASCGTAGTVPSEEETEKQTIETTTEKPSGDNTVPSETAADFDPEFTFKTTDRDGSEYDERVFSSYKLTMINFWEPWCGPCVSEMPDLGRLYESYKDKGFQIIGVYSETTMENEISEILKSGNISYLVLHYTSEFDRFQTGYVPTTVFVDGKGHIIKMSDGTDSVIGSKSYEEWEAIIKQYL